MGKYAAIFLLLTASCVAADSGQKLIDMPCGQIMDYRQDLLFRFVCEVKVPPPALEQYEHLGANATQKDRDEMLVDLKLQVLNIVQAERDLITFYSKHHYPPKSDGVIAPVVRFIQSEAFQKEERQLPLSLHDIEQADFAQVKAMCDHYAKIPLPSSPQLEAYLDEAVYGGHPPMARW